MTSFFKKMIALNLTLLSVLITPGGVYAGDPLNSQTNPAEGPAATVPAGAVAPSPANPLLKSPVIDSLGFINPSSISPVAIQSNAEKVPVTDSVLTKQPELYVACDQFRSGKVGNCKLIPKESFMQTLNIAQTNDKYASDPTRAHDSGGFTAVGTGSIIDPDATKNLPEAGGYQFKIQARSFGHPLYSQEADPRLSTVYGANVISSSPEPPKPLPKPISEIKVENKVGVPSVMLEKPVFFCTSSSSDVSYDNGGQVYCGAGDNPFKVGRGGYPDFDALVSLPQPAKPQGFTSWQQSAFGSLESLDFHSSNESYNYKTPGYQGSKTYLKEVTLPQQSYQPGLVTTTETVSVGPFTPKSTIDIVTDPLSRLASGYERNWFFINNTPAAGSPVDAVKMTATDIQKLSTRLAAVYSYSGTYGMGGSETVWMFTEKAAEKVPVTNFTKVEALKAEVTAAQAKVDKATTKDTSAQEQKRLAEKILADNQLKAINASKAAAVAVEVAAKAKEKLAIAKQAATHASDIAKLAKQAFAEASSAVTIAKRAVADAKRPDKAAAIELLNTKKLAAENASKTANAAAKVADKAKDDLAIAVRAEAKASNTAKLTKQAADKAVAIVTESQKKADNAAKAAVTSAQAKADAGKILEAKKAALAAATAPKPPKAPDTPAEVPVGKVLIVSLENRGVTTLASDTLQGPTVQGHDNNSCPYNANGYLASSCYDPDPKRAGGILFNKFEAIFIHNLPPTLSQSLSGRFTDRVTFSDVYYSSETLVRLYDNGFRIEVTPQKAYSMNPDPAIIKVFDPAGKQYDFTGLSTNMLRRPV